MKLAGCLCQFSGFLEKHDAYSQFLEKKLLHGKNSSLWKRDIRSCTFEPVCAVGMLLKLRWPRKHIVTELHILLHDPRGRFLAGFEFWALNVVQCQFAAGLGFLIRKESDFLLNHRKLLVHFMSSFNLCCFYEKACVKNGRKKFSNVKPYDLTFNFNAKISYAVDVVF